MGDCGCIVSLIGTFSFALAAARHEQIALSNVYSGVLFWFSICHHVRNAEWNLFSGKLKSKSQSIVNPTRVLSKETNIFN